MSVSRRFLKDLGLEADAIEKVISEHSETVTALKDKIDALEAEVKGYKPKAEEFDTIKKQYEDLKTKAEENADKDYDTLKAEYEKYKADVEAEKTRSKKTDKLKTVLKDIGIPERHFEKIIKYSNVDGLELDDKEELKDIAALKKSLETDWADHIDTTKQHGAQTSTPPETQTGKQDLGKLSMADYIAARKK